MVPESAAGTTDSAPEFSVVIPTYNHPPALRRCLTALMSQTVAAHRYEIVVVDDGSGPATREVAEEFAGRNPAVRYFYQPNQGPASARNNGARQARGAIILFTDDDCRPIPEWLDEMTRPFARTDVVIEGVKGAYRTEQKSVIAHFAQKEFESRYDKMSTADFIDFVDTYAAAFRRETFLRLGGFDTSFPVANNEDVEFSYRMAANGCTMVFNPKAIVYHTHPDTLYKYLRTKFGRAYWRMAVYRRFPEKMKSDSYTPQSLKLQILLSFLLLTSLVMNLAGVWLSTSAPHWIPPLWKQGSDFIAHHSRPLLLGSAILFFFTSVPFLITTLNVDWINRLVSAFRSFFKAGIIRALINRFKAWYASSALARLLHALGRAFSRALGGVISLLRTVLRSPPLRNLARCLRWTIRSLLLGIVWMARAAWWLLKSPFLLLRLTGSALRAIARWFGSLPPVCAVKDLLNAIGRTRLIMMPLSLLMLFLRGLVMGMGILWGLQSQQGTKGRFMQTAALILADIAGALLAVAAAYQFRAFLLTPVFGRPHIVPFENYLSQAPAMTSLLLLLFLFSGLYRPFKGLSQINEFMLITKASSVITIFAIVVMSFFDMPFSRSVIIITGVLAIAFIALFRWIARAAADHWTEEVNIEDRTRMLVVGTGEVARLICHKLHHTAEIDSLIVGLVDTDPAAVGRQIDEHPILGTVDQLGELIDTYKIQEVFVSLPLLPQRDVMDLVDRHSSRDGVRFYVVSNLFDLISVEIDLAEHHNIPLTLLRNEQMALLHQLFKRAFDMAVALAVITVSLPFWALIMAAIKLETDGGAFFTQDRVGKGGKLFKIYKFRTMHANTNKYDYSPSAPGDTRITRVGRFLRKTSLDEFPQFINVLKGEMSLVGPRPEMPFIVNQYKSWERQRLKVKPGITGIWQIMGRKDLPLHESLEYDFYYIKNQSLLLDLTILIRTIPVIFRGKGAY